MVLIVPKRKKSKKVKCAFCGKYFFRRSNAQKYCSLKCKHEGYLEHHREAQRTYVKRYGKKELGSCVEVNGRVVPMGLSPHRNPDVDVELKIVIKEHNKIFNKNSVIQEMTGLEIY